MCTMTCVIVIAMATKRRSPNGTGWRSKVVVINIDTTVDDIDVGTCTCRTVVLVGEPLPLRWGTDIELLLRR